MSTSSFQRKNVQNHNTFPSYSDELGSSTEDSGEISEGYTFSAEDATSSDDAMASLAKNSPRFNRSFRNKVNDDTSVVSTQSNGAVMTVLTTLDRALDAVVDVIIPAEKGITRSDTPEEETIPMKKQSSLVQKIISPRSKSNNAPETSKDPTMKRSSSPKSTDTMADSSTRSSTYFGMRKNSGLVSPKGNKTQDERDDISSRSPRAQTRGRDDISYGSDMLREGNEKISDLFDIKWMYAKKDNDIDQQQDMAISGTNGSGSDTKYNRSASIVRRTGLSRAASPPKDNHNSRESNKKKIWKRNPPVSQSQTKSSTAVNQSQTKSSKRTLLGRKNKPTLKNSKPEDQATTKTTKRSFFRRKKDLASNRAIVEEEEHEEMDCTDWFMSSLCGNSQAAEQTKQTDEKKKRKRSKWKFKINRKRKGKYSGVTSE